MTPEAAQQQAPNVSGLALCIMRIFAAQESVNPLERGESTLAAGLPQEYSVRRLADSARLTRL